MWAVKHISGVLFAVLAAAPCSGADGGTEAQKVDAAIAAFDKENAEFREELMKAPAAQRQDLIKQAPDAAAVVEQVAAFIKDSPEDAGVPRAAGWLLAQRSAGGERAAMYQLLVKHHLASPDLAETCFAGLYDPGDEAQQFLETVFEKADNPRTKAAAAYVLSCKLRRAGEDQQAKRADYLRAVVKDAGDLEFRGRSIKAAAEGDLFAAENLVIGKEAPEIEGEDVAGVTFKLSDYRGKVVVIDFWGDW